MVHGLFFFHAVNHLVGLFCDMNAFASSFTSPQPSKPYGPYGPYGPHQELQMSSVKNPHIAMQASTAILPGNLAYGANKQNRSHHPERSYQETLPRTEIKTAVFMRGRKWERCGLVAADVVDGGDKITAASCRGSPQI